MRIVKLGVLITDSAYGPMVVPILKAAVERGDEVRVFLMDDGCYMAEDPEFIKIAGGGPRAGMCDLNRRQRNLKLPDAIQAASQYDNISMVRWCDRLLVF
ncbi:MAG: hypothetical protein M0Z58_03915 [Nitrospiraceae bacterium]|nr:hypothetical protein [Nitrospiraceae bacterium]